MHALLVGEEHDRTGRHVHRKRLGLALGVRPHDGGDLAEVPREIEGLLVEQELPGPEAHHLREVVHHPFHLADLTLHHADRCRQLRRDQALALEELQDVADRPQGVAQFVREAAEEDVAAMQRVVRVLEAVFQRLQLCPQVGPVAHHLGEADVRIALAQRDQTAAHPDPCPVLSDMPAVVLGAVRRQRDRSFQLGQTEGAILLREEEVDGLSKHFLFRIAEDGLRRRAPANDGALAILKDESEVGRLLPQEVQRALGGQTADRRQCRRVHLFHLRILEQRAKRQDCAGEAGRPVGAKPDQPRAQAPSRRRACRLRSAVRGADSVAGHGG
jgi:hypothetical protein